MIYLDYSATTPVSDKVLESFTEACKAYGNPNSLHQSGLDAKDLIDNASEDIAKTLKVNPEDIIYTSGSSESNNLAIQGYAAKHPDKKHIITTRFEHSSVTTPLGALQNKGYDIDFVETDETGVIDLKKLESLIREDTLMVITIAVNSEIGIIQPYHEIAKLLRSKGVCYLLDGTQAVGKIPLDLSNIDMVSFSSHKIYGIKGVGCLIKKPEIRLAPMIYGGKSTTKFRSGTPATQLIVSTATAVTEAYRNLDEHYEYVKELNKYLRNKVQEMDNVFINSDEHCSPYVFNVSLPGNKDASLMQQELSDKGIMVSTQSACSSKTSKSIQIMSLFNDIARATSAIRISLSHLTTKDEVDIVISELKNLQKEG